MGYRSEVVLAIAPEAAHAFMTLTAQCPEVMQLCQDADQFESGYQDKGDWFIRWSHIKWYDSYPEVAALEAFINALESDDLSDYGEKESPEAPHNRVDASGDSMPRTEWAEFFKFVRVGEEMDDNEVRGYGFENIWIQRAIDY